MKRLMKKLLRLKENFRWDVEGIEFVIKEKIGPQHFECKHYVSYKQ